MRKALIALFAVALLVGLTAPAVAAKPPPDPIVVVGSMPVGSPEAEAFEAELASFVANKKIEVIYEDYFAVDDLIERINGPEPPDLIVTPQPAALAELAPYLKDLGRFVNERRLRRDFGDYLIDRGSPDGIVLGAPVKADLKSLVWYRPDMFAAYGYSIPQTFTELIALSDQMVANGHTPWCNYIESGGATGWLGTDWVEDLLLGTEGPDVYDQWVEHDVLFVDPRVEEAFERFMFMMDMPGYVFDRGNLTSESFWFNALPLGVSDCLMHRQASFFAFAIQDFGFDLSDFSTFKFPAVDTEFSDSALGAGAFVGALSHRNEVRRLVRFILSPKFGEHALADLGGWLLPSIRFDLGEYGDEQTRAFAEIVHEAIENGQFRFDASDLMPPEVGSGEFWFVIRDLLDGVRFLPAALADIDAAWPS